jgi:hypothetical protein
MRPPPIRNGWALIVIAVSLVIFMVLAIWFTSSWRGDDEARLTDTEVMHKLAVRMRAQWPQVPGPPAVYREQARRAIRLGDAERARRRTTMSLALDPEDLDGWVRLVILCAEGDHVECPLDAAESGAILLEISAIRPNHPQLSVALGWLALRNGNPARALRSVGTQPRSLTARLLRLRALGEAATLTDGEAVLELAPAHGPACRWTAQRALSEGRAGRSREILDSCVKAGADAETGEMRVRLAEEASAEPGGKGPKTLDSTPVSP